MATAVVRPGANLKIKFELSGQKFRIKAVKLDVEGQSVMRLWSAMQKDFEEMIQKTLFIQSKISVTNQKFNKIKIFPEKKEDKEEPKTENDKFQNAENDHVSPSTQNVSYRYVAENKDPAFPIASANNGNNREATNYYLKKEKMSPMVAEKQAESECSDRDCSDPNCSSADDNGGETSEEEDKWSLHNIQKKVEEQKQQKLRIQNGTLDSSQCSSQQLANTKNDGYDNAAGRKTAIKTEPGFKERNSNFPIVNPHKPTRDPPSREYQDWPRKPSSSIKQEPRDGPNDVAKHQKYRYESNRMPGLSTTDASKRLGGNMGSNLNGPSPQKAKNSNAYYPTTSFVHPHTGKEEKIYCKPDIYNSQKFEQPQSPDEEETKLVIADDGKRDGVHPQKKIRPEDVKVKMDPSSRFDDQLAENNGFPDPDNDNTDQMGNGVSANHLKKEPAIANRCPFSPYCAKQFGNKSNVERHVKTVHQKTKDYTCVRDKCDMSFAAKSNLLRHIQNIHEKKNWWKCGQCKESFNNKQHLDIHVKYVHQQYIAQTLAPENTKPIQEKASSVSHSIHRVKRKKHKRRREEYEYYKRSPISSSSERKESSDDKIEKRQRSDSQNENSVYKQDNPYFDKFVEMQEKALQNFKKENTNSDEMSVDNSVNMDSNRPNYNINSTHSSMKENEVFYGRSNPADDRYEHANTNYRQNMP